MMLSSFEVLTVFLRATWQAAMLVPPQCSCFAKFLERSISASTKAHYGPSYPATVGFDRASIHLSFFNVVNLLSQFEGMGNRK